jgi:hypothetical protein
MLMQAEKLRIRNDIAPNRMSYVSDLGKTVMNMCRGEWVMVTETQARSMGKIVKRLGGSATRYKANDIFYVFKILESPWMDIIKAR